ncbi:Modification methylase DpnIIA [Candidatus Magnetaquicoccaceae bacterium FCR-1]|uniref:site-specific DNA-methyltransferase (adenine-specific) n=1 Tax=Candidatus Magnetaquiglobus chichijimensis TaxID=3141448 RepID=A0ABQ0CAW7_9PROT
MNIPIKSPLAGWTGGKYLLSRTIIPLIPDHQCYAEPFAGAAWILFRKPRSDCEVINDINSDVVNLYRIVRFHWEAFVETLQWALTSREEFERFLETPPNTLTDIQRAVRFYYLHKLCFGGRMSGKRTLGTSAVMPSSLDPFKVRREVELAHTRLSRVMIEHLPYGDLIRRYDRAGTFFYIDPPYHGCEDYYGKGIFTREDFNALASQLAGIRGKFLMSLNDTPEIRGIFGAFQITPVTTRYSCTTGPRPVAKEVLIRNY